MRGDIQQEQEENLHARDDNRGISKKTRVGLIAQPQNESVCCKQQRPEQQRPFLSGPENRELIRARKILVAVVKDVGDREIIGECGRDQHYGSQQNGSERSDSRAARGFPETLGSGSTNDQRQRADHERIAGKSERQQKRKTTDLRQCNTTELGHGGTLASLFRNTRLEQPRRP